MKTKLDGGKLQKNDRLLAGWLLGLATVLLLGAAGNLYVGSFQDDGSGRTSIPYTDITGTPTVPSLPVSIPNGGTGQTTAPAALSALGGASLTANNTYASSSSNNFENAPLRVGQLYSPQSGLNGVHWTFDNTLSPAQDGGVFFTGSANSSGQGIGYDYLIDNAPAPSQSTNSEGYVIMDNPQIVSVGYGSSNTFGNNAGAGLLFVENAGAPFVFAPAGPGNEHQPLVEMIGTTTQGNHVGFGILDGSTNHYPYGITIRNNGTNFFNKAQDGMLLGYDYNAQTGRSTFLNGSVMVSNENIVNGSSQIVISTNGGFHDAYDVNYGQAGNYQFEISTVGITAGMGGQVGPGTISGLALGLEGSGGGFHTQVYMTPADGPNANWIGFHATTIGGTDAETTNTASQAGGGNQFSVANLQGSVGMKAVWKTSAYTATADDQVIYASGTTTITLEDSTSSCKYRTHIIKNVGVATVTIATTGSQTIDGSTTVALSAHNSDWVQSDGTNWNIICSH